MWIFSMLVSAFVRMWKWDPKNTWSGGIFNSVVYVFYDTLWTIGESISHINISCHSYFVAVATDTSEYTPIVVVGSSEILHSPDALYFLSLVQIDFQYNESTSRETSCVDSIESNRQHFQPPSKPRCAKFFKSHANQLPVWRIDMKGDDSCRFNRIESNRQHFQPTIKAQMRYIFLV